MQDFGDDGSEGDLRGERAMAAEGVEEARLAEFFTVVIERFGDAVGVEGENIAGREVTFADFAVPLFENAEDGGGGVEACDGVVAAKEKRGKMAAIGETEDTSGVVVF